MFFPDSIIDCARLAPGLFLFDFITWLVLTLAVLNVHKKFLWYAFFRCRMLGTTSG